MRRDGLVFREREDRGAKLPLVDKEPEGTCFDCGKLIVCELCETCAEHCITEGGPDACWQAHEDWRLGKGDPTFDVTFASVKPRRGSIPPAPKPRWRS